MAQREELSIKCPTCGNIGSALFNMNEDAIEGLLTVGENEQVFCRLSTPTIARLSRGFHTRESENLGKTEIVCDRCGDVVDSL
jgi:hypothetical protein